MSDRLTVCSEIFTENNNSERNELLQIPNTVDSVTNFRFKINNSQLLETNQEKVLCADNDGDLVLKRKCSEEILKIEHSKCTIIDLVGLQVWRGALLLADFVSHFANAFRDKTVLELGCGVGLTSIIAAVYAKHVIFSDIDAGGILDLVKKNIENNRRLIESRIQVEKIDFFDRNYSKSIEHIFDLVDIILAADVIFDNDLTEGFVQTLMKITENRPSKIIYISLEKRYVFTVANLDVIAPCYEYFISYLEAANEQFSLHWKIEQVSIDFPKYFDYARSKHLILLRITT